MLSSFTSLVDRFKYFKDLSAVQLNISMASANSRDDNHLLTCPIKRKNVRHFLASGIRDAGEQCILLSADDVGLGLIIND